MEIYTDSGTRTASLNIPVTPVGAAEVEVYDGTELVHEPATVAFVSGTLSFDLPFSLVQIPRELRIHWKFTYTEGTSKVYESDTFVNVIVPLVSVETAREELEIPASITDSQIMLTERKVRRIIERVTGQVFGPFYATLLAVELEDGSLRLPKRLLSLTSVGGVQNDLLYVLANGGWRLAIIYPRKRNGIRAGEVPIVDPWAAYRHVRTRKVQVTGRWGYEVVPSDIAEAALILIEQYLCPDSIYVERYLKTMTAADFRFEFNPGAYRGTGNVIVDHLLSKYIVGLTAVI